MLGIIKSFFAAISTYSKIPVPQMSGDEKDFRFTISFFPFVGVIIYAFLSIWIYVSRELEIEKIVFSIVAMLIIALLTGGIHIDGYMDVQDAKCSYGDKEKKLEILKDPHIGAFSVIRLLEYAGAFLAGLLLTDEKYYPVLFTGVIFSRVLSGLSVCLFDGAKESGMIAYVKRTKSQVCTTFLIAQLIFDAGLILIFFGVISLVPVILSLAGFFYYKYKSKKTFGGITGDTSGNFLCLIELLWVLFFAVLSVV